MRSRWTVALAANSKSLPIKPSASTRTRHGSSHSKVRRPSESVRPRRCPAGRCTDAPEMAVSPLSLTVIVRLVGRCAGRERRARSRVPQRTMLRRLLRNNAASFPEIALEPNDAMLFTFSVLDQSVEQIDQVRSDLLQRDEGECALGQSRVGNLESRLVQAEVAHQQDIQVEGT